MVIGKAGRRTIKSADFFQGLMTTALGPDEIIVEIRLPAWPDGRRWGFQEFARRRGDFALAAAAVFYDPDEAGKATNAHVGVVGVGNEGNGNGCNGGKKMTGGGRTTGTCGAGPGAGGGACGGGG